MIEWISNKLRRAYREVHEPLAPRRKRLGLSPLEVQANLRPHGSLDEVVERQLARKKFIEIVGDWDRALGESRH